MPNLIGGKRRKASSKKSSKSRKQRGGVCINKDGKTVDHLTGVSCTRKAIDDKVFCPPGQSIIVDDNGNRKCGDSNVGVNDLQLGLNKTVRSNEWKTTMQGGKRRKASSKKSSKKARKH